MSEKTNAFMEPLDPSEEERLEQRIAVLEKLCSAQSRLLAVWWNTLEQHVVDGIVNDVWKDVEAITRHSDDSVGD